MNNQPKCILSGETMTPWLYIPCDWRRPLVNQGFQIYWCERSELGFVYPLPESDEIPEFYQVNYYTHNSGSRKQSTINNFFDKLRIHISYRFDHGVQSTVDYWQNLAGKANANICEIGCGNGDRLKLLLSAGNQVVGVEPDPAAANHALSQGINVFQGTAELLPDQIVNASKFDLVIMNHVLEHTLDPLLALSNAKKLLNQGGKLVVETPNNKAIGMKQAGITWFNLDVPRHLYFFTPKSLCTIVEKVGLTVLETSYQGYCRQFQPNWINTEKQIWQEFNSLQGKKNLPRCNSNQKAWLLLCQTLLAPSQYKYDSVRVITKST